MRRIRTCRHHPTLRCTAIALLVTGTIVASSSAPARPATDTGGTPVMSGGASQGVVTFREPKRYAVLEDSRGRIRRLYTAGDVLIDPARPRRQVIIDRVAVDGVVVFEHPRARPRRVTVGQRIPGYPEHTLAAVVMLTRLRYRLKAVDRVAQAEPVLVSLVGSTAVLEREVAGTGPRLASSPQAAPPEARRRPPPQLETELVTRVPIKEVDEGSFVLDGEALEPVLDTVRRLVPGKAAAVMAAFPQQGDVRVDMTSPLVDGTLHRRGFTVKNLKVAQAFGLQAGDTVLSLNGRAVNSPLNAWWAFQELLIKHRSVSRLHVEIEREGKRVVNIYQIR